MKFTKIMRNNDNTSLKRGLYLNLIFLLLLIIVLIIGLNVGMYKMSPDVVFHTLFGKGSAESKKVLFDIRIPRLILGTLVGIGMGISGVVMQNLLHNDLASPGTLGVSSGSSLFVTIYIALLAKQNRNQYALPFLALIGGIIAAVLIFALSYTRKRQISHTRVIMTGVAMSAVFGAVSVFAMYILDQNQLEFLQRWNSGELWGTDWNYIGILFVWQLIFGAIIYYKSRTLNVIGLGYDLAKGLGINVMKEFLILAFCAVAISSGTVAFGGNFFFLGLIAPHIARKVVGEDLRVLLPASGMIASIIVVTADLMVSGIEVFGDVPTGIIVSVISVPYFIYLLFKAR